MFGEDTAPAIRRNPHPHAMIYAGSSRAVASAGSVRAMDQHAAHHLDSGAHAMRNDLATLRMATRLVDDTEVASSMAEALDDLQVRLERAIVAARIDLDRRPEHAGLDAADLLQLAARRATREGMADPAVEVTIEPERISAPGTWAERLVADLLHGAGSDWIDALAAACGASVDRADAAVVVRFGSAG